MLKAFVEKITELAEVKTFNLKGRDYSSKELHRIDPPVDRPRSIEVSGLDAICKLVSKEIERVGTTIMISVDRYDRVAVMTTYLDDYSRNYLYTAKADAPGIHTGFREREQALIELRSLFLPNDGVAYMLDLLSKMTKENTITSKDNGVTQTVEAQCGIALKEKVNVKPRVSLKPFRTFLEVEQPESEFLLRIDEEGRVGLFEADGGIWKLEAKANVAKYLEDKLSNLIEAGQVIVMI